MRTVGSGSGGKEVVGSGSGGQWKPWAINGNGGYRER